MKQTSFTWFRSALRLSLLLTIGLLACTSRSEESATDIFDLPPLFGGRDTFDLAIDDEIPRWDYPDIPSGEGKITRILWMAKGEAQALVNFVKGHDLIREKAVAATVVAKLPSQFRRSPKNGNIENYANISLEAISLLGLPEDVDTITDLIVGIQKSVPQIEVGIRVVEILETDSFSFGIDTFWGSLEDSEQPTRTFFNNAATSLGLPEIFGRGGTFNPDTLSTPLLIDLGTVTKGVQVDFLVRALKLFSKADLLSAPHIGVLDGHTAEITAGEEIPFFQPNFNSSGFTTVTTQFKSVGIKLYVTPKVIGRDLVRINLTTAVDAVTGQSTFETSGVSITNPVITVRQASTFMDVHNGDTAIIGGLLTRSKFDNENRVPIVGEIPILNVLFSSRSKQLVQSNLVFFISPRIVDPSRERRRLITPVIPNQDPPKKN